MSDVHEVKFDEEPEYVPVRAAKQEKAAAGGILGRLVKSRLVKDEASANKIMLAVALVFFALAIGIVIVVQIQSNATLKNNIEPQTVRVRQL